jgi:hypothetical protein
MTERDIQGNFTALRELFGKYPNDISEDETRLVGDLVLRLLEGALLDLNKIAQSTEYQCEMMNVAEARARR